MLGHFECENTSKRIARDVVRTIRPYTLHFFQVCLRHLFNACQYLTVFIQAVGFHAVHWAVFKGTRNRFEVEDVSAEAGNQKDRSVCTGRLQGNHGSPGGFFAKRTMHLVGKCAHGTRM